MNEGILASGAFREALLYFTMRFRSLFGRHFMSLLYPLFSRQ